MLCSTLSHPHFPLAPHIILSYLHLPFSPIPFPLTSLPHSLLWRSLEDYAMRRTFSSSSASRHSCSFSASFHTPCYTILYKRVGYVCSTLRAPPSAVHTLTFFISLTSFAHAILLFVPLTLTFISESLLYYTMLYLLSSCFLSYASSPLFPTSSYPFLHETMLGSLLHRAHRSSTPHTLLSPSSPCLSFPSSFR